MLSSYPLKKVQKVHSKKVMGRKLLHSVIKVKNFLNGFDVSIKYPYCLFEKKINNIILALFTNFE
jgi:hypothetical protein